MLPAVLCSPKEFSDQERRFSVIANAFFIDGLIEACNAADDLFGLERLKASLALAAGLLPHTVTDTLVSTVDRWSGLPPGDDLTLVIVDWTSAGHSGASTLTSGSV